MSKYFVMIAHPSNNVPAIPMTEDNDDIAFFDDEDDARWAGENNSMAKAFGYEIFQLGTGES